MSDVRISVTDRCDFRCRYCMPAEGLPWIDRDSLLSYEEIARVVALLADLGVRSVRLTGGEPLVRKGLHHLVRLVSGLSAIDDLSLTTNGYLLEKRLPELVDAGLTRINVSLDSLVRDRFFELTRRDALDRVLAGLRAAEGFPELSSIKVNVVAIRGYTEDEVLAFADLARRKPYIVRFIEYMPLDADRRWTRAKVLPMEEIEATIASAFPLEPVDREAHATARRMRFADGNGEVGFISPVTAPFCSDCNRIRLTAEGQLRTCLFALEEVDLREAIRCGSTDTELEEIVRSAVWRKELKHRIGDEAFRPPDRPMSQIGG